MLCNIKWKKMSFALVCLIITIIIITGFTACGFKSKNLVSDTQPQSQNDAALNETVSEIKDNKTINILLLGLDEGDLENRAGPKRSDTMMVASINPVDKTINMLSIPRDSKVSIPGRSGYDKITHAFFYGGPKLAVRTVEDNFHIPINYYTVIDWKAFIEVIDILGGVDINVEHDMDYEDPYENLYIHLSKGYQHLNGEQAGQYVRFRHDELGDIGRVQRQEVFLKALNSQLFKTGTILKLPALITTISHYLQTDINTATLVKIANVLKDMRTDSIHTEMIPGDFATIDDISYWVPDMARTQNIVNSKFRTR